ncbi:MAG: hypothetical protein ACON4U_19700 [Myxococcota bacterium]
MKRLSPICFLFLFGCPVEPQDIQAPEQGAQGQGGTPSPQNPEDVAQNNGNNAGLNNGRPPGTPPPQNQGQVQNGQAPIDGAGEGSLPPLEASNEAVGEVPTEPNGATEQPNLPPDGAQVQVQDNAGNMDNNENMENGGNAPNDGPQNGTGTPPDIPAGAMPTFNTPPSFGTLIGEGETITVNLNVTGSETFNMEFVISQEVDGRQSPRVIHMERSVSANTSVRAPANYDYPVWLIITADVNGDGPSDDDLIGGTTEPISLGTDDITLDISLEADDDWMSQVPWYTKGLEDGQPITP